MKTKNNFIEFIETKWKIITITMFVIVSINQCSIKRNINNAYKEIYSTNEYISEIELNSYDSHEACMTYMQIIYRIHMYEFLKLQLDDNNKIVRTVVRPDDKIREYDDEIKKLKEKLDEMLPTSPIK